MPAAILGPIAGSVVGGLMGGDEQQSQTASKEPWAEAAPWLKENIKTGQDLQRYYQQSPFNQIQQQGYQNLFGDIDNYRQNVNPGLASIANKYLQRDGGPGISLMGMQPQGQPQQGPQGGAPGGLMGPSGQGGQGMGGFGLLNFQNLNPFTAANGIPPPPAPVAPDTSYDAFKKRQQEDAYAQYMEAELRGAGA